MHKTGASLMAGAELLLRNMDDERLVRLLGYQIRELATSDVVRILLMMSSDQLADVLSKLESRRKEIAVR